MTNDFFNWPAAAGTMAVTPGIRRRAVDDVNRLREAAERDQLWASLRALLPEIERLGREPWEDTDRARQLVRVLAGVVAAELRYRAGAAEDGP